MLNLLLVATTVLVLLMIGEFLSRRTGKQPEINRKFVHITVGSFVAFWPLFLDWNQILIMSMAFLAVVLLSRKFHIFRAIHSVQRPTWGEVFFALIVGVLALVTHDGWIFAAAVLHMSLADGFAAIVGSRYGKKQTYKIFGHTKSLIGSLTFIVLSLMILSIYAVYSGNPLPLTALLCTSVAATALESAGMRGLDNLSVPLFVAFSLSLFV